MPLETLARKASEWGYDGLELACWGDHLDVRKAAEDKNYCEERKQLLARYGLNVWAISNHLVGQAVLDPIDERHKAILPPHVWGDGDPNGVRERAIEEMKLTARAAKNLGVQVVNGFTGSPIWHLVYPFPPVPPQMIEDGFKKFAETWKPILDEFEACGVKFALEVHPTEIAFDLHTARKALEAVDYHPAFGFNFDPSHLHWQGVDPVKFIYEFPDRIFHMHVKDAIVTLDGRSGILSSHLPFGDPRRGWDFRSPGRGGINFEEIIRALNNIGYNGPLSVEWEDSGMDREHGAKEACEFVRKLQFKPSEIRFEAAFER
jgi:sugar phosphate isomerase/epimerase